MEQFKDHNTWFVLDNYIQLQLRVCEIYKHSFQINSVY